MMPITPSGTRTREICKPFGRVHDAVTSPTGSGRLAMSRKPLAIALTRASSSESRSMKASSRPLPRAASMSFLLASRIAPERASIRSAMASSAAFFCSVEASASVRAASRAKRPI